MDSTIFTLKSAKPEDFCRIAEIMTKQNLGFVNI